MKAIQQARDDYKNKPSSLLGWIVIASYLYYHKYFSLLSDEDFDKMCSTALKMWDTGIFNSHPLVHLVTRDDLQAGSLYTLKESDLTHMFKWMCGRIMREEITRQAQENGNDTNGT